MNPETWARVRDLFHACLELDVAERDAWLGRETADSPDIGLEVASLLASADRSSEFLERPAVEAPKPVPAEEWVGRRLGAYEIVARIAVGGMGEVYKAVRADDQYRQEVAIKLIRRGFELETTLARFRAERQILANLDHPNIARLFDAGVAPTGQPYFVMPFIDGEPIDRHCETQGLSVRERLALFVRVCEAVHYAHQHLTVHRDLKPANILVDREGHPKLLDFGIAKVVQKTEATSTTVTQTAFAAMTPDYASPEQVRGSVITTASDIYSLGVILYRLLTGRSPYRATQTEPYTLAQEVCGTIPLRPSASLDRDRSWTRQLAGDLDNIVLMALRKEPERRYASARDLALDIERHLNGRAVSATPDSWRYQLGKFVARHRVSVGITAVSAIALIIGLLALALETRIARAERARAERRFEDVRHLANALIFDLDDAVARLQGSTETRRILVEKALGYLDRLASESEGDDALRRDLGAAYQKLGDIQGNPGQSNLGLTSEARRSYDKAIAIRESLSATHPLQEEDALALAANYESLADFALETSADLPASLAYTERGLKVLEPLYRAAPMSVKIGRRLIGLYNTQNNIHAGSGSAANLGDVAAGQASLAKAVVIADTLLQSHPDDLDVQRARAILAMNEADNFIKQGNRPAALARYRLGLDTFKRLYAHSAAARDLRVTGLVSERMANVSAMDGNFAAALEDYRAAREIFASERAADPNDLQAMLDVASVDALNGNAMADAGDRDAGLRTLDHSLEQLEVLHQRDPNNVFVKRLAMLAYVLRGQQRSAGGTVDGALSDYRQAEALVAGDGDADTQAIVSLAALRIKIAKILTRRGERDASRANYERALHRLASFEQAAHPPLDALYALADGYTVRALSALATGDAIGCEAARPDLERSLATWRRIPHPAVYDPSGFRTLGPELPTQHLARCVAVKNS